MSITPFFHVYHKYVFIMININKIRLSGTTYNIQDLNATKTVELTQAEYDALSPKDPNVFYIITDAEAGDLSNYYTKSETDGLLDTKLDVTAYTPTDLSNYYTKSETSGATEISTALASKQTTLTAGTGISIVDNVISATGGGGSITIDPSLDSGSTNAVANSAITTAINDRQAWRNGGYWGSFVRVDSETYNNRTYDKPMINRYMNYKGQTNLWETLDNLGYFVRINGKKIIAKDKKDQDLLDYDLVATSAITTSVTSSSTDSQVPSAKAVYDQFGGLKLVKLTQSEYDSLTTKDSSTLYIING